MKNLENYGVQELNALEVDQLEGGVIGILSAAFLLGRRIEYMKNGGGFFDFYL